MTNSAFPAAAVLEYWFGASLQDSEALDYHSRRWFKGGAAMDHEIQVRFGEWIAPVAEAAEDAFDTPESVLAAILVLDQFPRHIFRGSARAFAFDDKALQLLDRAVRLGWDRQIHPLYTSFLYMPLQHAEDLQRQEQGVALYRKLTERLPPPYLALVESNLKFAEQHRDLIQQFGRFPHRNDALGRTSTVEEQDYLNNNGARFGQ